MSDIDDTIRRDLHQQLDRLEVPTAGRAAVVRSDLRRSRRRRALTAAAVVVVVLSSIGGARLIHRADRGILPTHPHPSRVHAEPPCPTIYRVTCLGHNTYRFPLVRPVDWQIPSHFGISNSPATPFHAESLRDDGHPGQSGVTVMERARASSPNGKGAQPGVADSPQALVEWIAHRPFLSAGPVLTTTLDGHRAWQVRTTLAPHLAPGPAVWNTSRCYMVVYQPVAEPDRSCVYGDYVSEYTAFTLPRVGTTLVWAWSVGPNPDLRALGRLMDGLSFPAH